MSVFVQRAITNQETKMRYDTHPDKLRVRMDDEDKKKRVRRKRVHQILHMMLENLVPRYHLFLLAFLLAVMQAQHVAKNPTNSHANAATVSQVPAEYDMSTVTS